MPATTSEECAAGALVGAQTDLAGIPQRFLDGLDEGRQAHEHGRQVCRTGQHRRPESAMKIE